MSDNRLVASLIDRPEDISVVRSMGLQQSDLQGMANVVYALLAEMELDGVTITRETVQDVLRRYNQDPVAEYVAQLPATKEGEAEFWAVSIVTRGIKAQELEIAKLIAKTAKNEGEDSEEHIPEYQRLLDQVSHRYVRMRNPVAENPAEELRRSRGWHIATGLGFIDRLVRLTSSGVHFLAGDPGSGKSQPLDCKVLTPTGWKRIGDIKIGDAVVNPDGGTAHVVGVFPQGATEVYKLTFSDGAQTECCKEHLWHTQTYSQRNRDQHSVKSLEEIIEAMKSDSRERWHYVPVPKLVDFTERELHDRYIVDIERAGVKETACIKLDSENQLYITDDYIVTHNTSIAIQMTTNALRDDIPVTIILAESGALEIKLGMLLLLQHPSIDVSFISRVNYDPTARTENNIEKIEQAWLNNYHNAPLRIYEASKGIEEVTAIVASTERSLVIVDHAYAIVAQSDADHGIREHQQFMRLFTNVRKAAQRNNNIVVMMNQFKLSGREGGERGPDAQYGGSGVRNIADTIIHIWPDETDLAHATIGTILVNAECHKVRARLVADEEGNPINPIGRRERFWLDSRYRMITDEIPRV